MFEKSNLHHERKYSIAFLPKGPEHVGVHCSGSDEPWRVVELNHLVFPSRIDIFKYVIYGIAAAFFVYGILLMVEGFFTTGAIKDLYGDFKITTCGRCVSAWVRSLFALRASCGFISVALWCLCSSARNGSNIYFLTQ